MQNSVRVKFRGRLQSERAIVQTVTMARKLSFDFKLTARTAPELYEAFNHLVLKLEGEGIKFRKRKVSVEAAVNAVLLDFFDKPAPDREALIRRNVPRFEEIMRSDEAVPIGIEQPSEPRKPPVIGPPRERTAHAARKLRKHQSGTPKGKKSPGNTPDADHEGSENENAKGSGRGPR